MKTFLIFEKNKNGTFGDKLRSYQALEIDNSMENFPYTLVEPYASHFELPEGMDEAVVKPVLENDQWILREDPELLTQKSLRLKQEQVIQAYERMNKDVLDQMALVFGTQNPDSASAYEKTWSMMAQSPLEWTDLGLKDDSGMPLDTEEKILAFATSKIAAVTAYGKYRMQRIGQFRAEKEAIVGSLV